MNPLQWKREHQAALLVGAGIGFLLGCVAGLHEIGTYTYGISWSVERYNDHSINLYWLAVAGVGAFGAILGAGIIYAVHLTRR